MNSSIHAVSYSAPTVDYSKIAVSYSKLTVSCSTFAVSYSKLAVGCSTFAVRHSIPAVGYSTKVGYSIPKVEYFRFGKGWFKEAGGSYAGASGYCILYQDPFKLQA